MNQIFSKKIIANLGYTSMLDYYLVVCENERTAVYGTVRQILKLVIVGTYYRKSVENI